MRNEKREMRNVQIAILRFVHYDEYTDKSFINCNYYIPFALVGSQPETTAPVTTAPETTTTTIATTTTTEHIPGDHNGDGKVNLKDVVLLRRYVAGGWGVTLIW